MINYRLPAEWEPHKATWLAWPHNSETWHNGSLSLAQAEYAVFVREILKGEDVHLLLPVHERKNPIVLKLESAHRNLYLHEYETNDSWIRDYGPDFLVSEDETIALNWKYNSWGDKYPPYDADNAATDIIIPLSESGELQIPFVLEGGSVEFDGQGNVITTKSCLLNSNRNPDYTFRQIEEILKVNFGVKNIIWLEKGIEGDDTDGHIDDFCRFTSSGVILFNVGRADSKDEQGLERNRDLLNLKIAELGLDYSVESLPMPLNAVVFHGELLPASYANFYVCNAAVLVPVFDDPHDEVALEIIRTCFTGRSIIGIPSRSLLVGLGGLHCLSKQQAAVDKL